MQGETDMTRAFLGVSRFVASESSPQPQDLKAGIKVMDSVRVVNDPQAVNKGIGSRTV